MGRLSFISPYRKALRGVWWPEFRDWVRGHIREELGVIIAGGVTSAVAALALQRLYSETANIQAALITGFIGGAGFLAVLLLWKWLAGVLSAPSKLYAKQEARIAELSGELAAKVEAENTDEVSRRVNRALGNLFDAHRELQIVQNRTSDDAWDALSQRLEEYKAAFALLPPVARRFHERSAPALTHFVRVREFERLPEVMDDASDIMINGECDLDITVSLPNPEVVTDRSSRRDRFIILNMVVGNRETQPVSLLPVLQVHLDPGRMYVTYQADAEPHKVLEEHRREFPKPANPPLNMPLQLLPKNAATGYWCFFIGNSLENAERLLGGRPRIKAVLEIRDVVSGRRTKSNIFYLELDLIKSLLAPAKKRKTRARRPTPSEDPAPSTPSG